MSWARPVTPAQLRKLHAVYRELGMDRAGRLADASAILWETVESFTDLSQDQASIVIDLASKQAAAVTT